VRLALIRHGESHHSLRGTIAGVSGCAGLTEQGFAQTRALTARLRASGELFDSVALLSSPVLRARQTAEIVRDVLPVGAIEVDDGLCEVHPGEADGLAWEDYRARYGTFDLLSSPERPFAPGGESWSVFTARVRAALARLAAQYDGQTVVAVSHAGFIVASILVLFDIPRPGTGARLDPTHTGLTEWRVSGQTWQLVRYNDATHLLTST
jgi:broad specificity phosphatase PhoE